MTDHRCYRAERCARSERKPGGLIVGAQIPAETGLCLDCTRHVTDGIAALPQDYADLGGALERQEIGMTELVHSTRDLPAALQIGVAALQQEMVRLALLWAEPVADRMRIDWDAQMMAGNTRPHVALERAASLLSNAMPVLLNVRDEPVQVWADNGWYWSFEPADGIDGALDLLRLHEVAYSTLGRTKLVHHLGVPCPSIDCGMIALVRPDGSETVHCEACGRRWPWEEWQRLVLVAVA